MNTRRDTDEGRAKPSVWPVYVMAAVVLVGAAPLLAHGFRLPEVVSGAREAAHAVGNVPGPQSLIMILTYGPYLAIVVCGLFGVLTAVGLVLLRRWGWWCGLLWTIVVAAAGGLLSLLLIRDIVIGWVAMIPLLIWPLATRRRLFFPHV